MEALLDSIHIAVSDGASDDERRRGVIACRAVADALEGGIVAAVPAPPPVVLAEPLRVEPPFAETPRAETALAHLVANPLAANPFAGMTADEILELAIAKLRGAVGDDTPTPPPAGQPFRLTLVPVPRHS
ncbi:MAG: hypothetical protein HS111_34690 [Kofleriaceae bacterium]|nr:hypothetical protein [Kofleriaceae bacterium]